jgi:hypothetical protein
MAAALVALRPPKRSVLREAIAVGGTIAAFQPHLMRAMGLRPCNEEFLVERMLPCGLASSFTIQPSMPFG